MKNIIIISIFCCLLSLVMYESLKPPASKKAAHKKGALYSSDFDRLTREQKIKKCGECHQKEYQDELAGPHYIAYTAISSFKRGIDSGHYAYPYYTKFVDRVYEHNCLTCHASDNLFNTLLKDRARPDSLIHALCAIQYPQNSLTPRVASQRVTGVDCMTCHFDGSGVLSSDQRFKKASTAPCNPMYDSYFSNTTMTCYPCHNDEANTYGLAVKANGIVAKSCNSCHVQKDVQGHPTHYYYWTKEKGNVVNNVYAMLFDDFSLVGGPSAKSSYIRWRNQALPHVIGLCPEMIFTFTVLGADSAPLGQTVIRINRKKEYDEIMGDQFEQHSLGGTAGVDSIPLYGHEMLYPITVTHTTAAKYLKIEMVKKSQYWAADKTGKQTLVSIRKIH